MCVRAVTLRLWLRSMTAAAVASTLDR